METIRIIEQAMCNRCEHEQCCTSQCPLEELTEYELKQLYNNLTKK